MIAINKYLLLVLMLVVFILNTACTQEEMKHDSMMERMKQSKEGVDLFISPDYRIVSNKEEIMKLEPAVLTKSSGSIKLLDILVRIKNEGTKQASNLDVNINEPTPLNYIQASIVGIKRTHLDSNSETQLRFVVAFDDDLKLASFKEKVTCTISWDEDNERKQITVGF
ncbi:hypothetical protein [Paenibacillus assamensis]|uniref:hypothetical protein n=1 Tax=Paenibacillus assamensis TaxID=311244 RepID=UPI00048BF23C|nr:hypothetical protein [Paenibacillus assamensis]